MLKKLSPNIIGAIYIFISATMYAILPVMTKIAYASGLQPIYLIWLRYLFTFVFLIGLLLFLKRKIILISPLVVLQGLFFVLSGITYFLCLRYLSAGLSSVIFFTHPAIVAVLAIIIFKEKATPQLIAGLVLAITGIILIAGITGDSSVNISGRGLMYCVLACLTYAGYILVGQKNVAADFPLSMVSTFSLMGLLSLPLFFHSTPGFLVALSPAQLIIVLLISLFNTVIPIVFLLYGVKKIGASRGSLISSIEPALTIIIAYLALGEVMTMKQLLGSLLVLASIFLALYSPRQASEG
jgi:drug/metabolite transporter (DMT)-like permease